MTHQAEIEKRKYRNWVRGGLAYKYLKQGLEDFADDVVKQDHINILSAINHTPGTSCNLCCLRNLQPIHTCKIDNGKKTCPHGLFNCDCLHGKKQRCPANICDGIMEEILKSHESKPPQPYWRNTDIQKWCKEPWEVAKCFINAPGYSDKTSAADIDISGLLHVFINNINLHSHLACSMAGNNIFIKVRDTRNKLFHSATMEMEERDMFKCIDDIVEILEDPKELKGRPKAQQAVNKLKLLKNSDFLITTHNEVEVCREALASVNLKSKQIEQAIQDAKNFISDEKKDIVERLQQAADKHKEDVKDVSDQVTGTAKKTIQNSLHGAVKEFDKHSEILYERVKKLETDVSERVEKVETRVSERVKKLETDVKKLETDVSERLGKLETDFLSVEKRVTSLERTVEKLDFIRHMFEERLDYVKGKQELQDNLVKFYQTYYVKTSLSPLKQQQDSVNITDVYVHPEIVVIEEKNDVDRNARETARTPKLNVAEEEQVPSLHNSIQKLKGKAEQSGKRNEGKAEQTGKRHVKGYHEIFQTKNQRHKNIYILGDVGTGKSTFCKMMIENWCNAVTGSNEGSICDENTHDRTECRDTNMATRCEEDVSEMGQYEFLFFIPLQNMSAFESDTTVDMIKELTKDRTSNTELIDRIFQEDSRSCLIIIDSLDEWTPPKEVVRKLHVSYGIPNGDKAKDAIVITLSRPSAKGIINLRNSEFDLKLQILGLSSETLMPFIERYISKSTVTNKSCQKFMFLCKSNQIEHVEKTPLLLQQLLWLYCNGKELGNSVSETYCHIFNAMYGWSDHKKNVRDKDASQSRQDYKTVNLPAMLQRFPRLKENKLVLFRLGKIAYETLTLDMQATCGLSCLIKKDLSDGDIDELTRFGILTESTCYDPTLEDTQLAFIHISYLEFFAAMFVTTCYNMEQSASVEQNNKEVSILDELFGFCKSASDALQLSNVFKMICGLSPVLTSIISRQISCIVNEDKNILKLRRNGSLMTQNFNEIDLIQGLMVDCLKQCGSGDKTMISLSDVDIDCPFPLIYLSDVDIDCPIPLQEINPDDVMSLTLKLITSRIVKYIKDFNNVQYLHFLNTNHKEHLQLNLSEHKQLKVLTLINCSNTTISALNTEELEEVHIEFCTEIEVLQLVCLTNACRLTVFCLKNSTYDLTILSLISQQAQLRQLTLQNVRCKQKNNHDIDLSKQRNLQELALTWCPDISFTGFPVSYSHLSSITKLHFSYITVNTASLVLFIQELPLRQLTLICVSGIQFAVIGPKPLLDLSKQSQLRELKIEKCDQLEIYNINTEKLEQVYIRNNNLHFNIDKHMPVLETHLFSNTSNLKEVHLEKLTCSDVSLLSLLQHTSLRQLTLICVSCNQSDDNGQMRVIHIDLGKLCHLQKLWLSDCEGIKIADLNTQQLEQVHIRKSPGLLDFGQLSNARNLDELSFESAINQLLAKNILHTLHQLRKLTLKNIDIDDNALTVTPEMKRLTYIELENTTLSLNTWHTFVDSLLTLYQLIHVKAHFKERAKELNDYVLSKQKFKVLYDSKLGIYFRSDVSAYSSRSCFFGLDTLTTNSI